MKFCKTGSITLSLTANQDLKAVVIKIVDTGIGFDEASLPRLLQPFTKDNAHSAGAGLGLYITRTLVDKMGGKLDLRSSPGKGTTFTAILPTKLKPVLGPGVRNLLMASASPIMQAESPNGALSQPLRVLVVDDNTICRRLLRMALKRCPIKVSTAEAENGQQALSIFGDFNPDLVLTDVSMPVMDGISSASRMRQISEELSFPRCRIYALTGLGSSDPRMQSLGMKGTAALDGWLIKGQNQLDDIYSILADLKQVKQISPKGQMKSLPLVGLAIG